MRYGSISSGNYFVPLLIGAKKFIYFELCNLNYIIHYYFFILVYKSIFHAICCDHLNRKYIHDQKVKSNNIFSSYLAGLFEGDGHIIIPKSNAKKIRYVIAITFHEKDLKLCEYIKNKLGHSWIRMKTKEHACVLTFHTDEGLMVFVKLVNGYLRTPKLYKFNLIIDYLNNKYGLNYFKYEPDYSNLGQNSWLAGFVDADGGFLIRYASPNCKKFRIACMLKIEQRMLDPFSSLSYEPILLLIAKFFNVNLLISKHNNKNYFQITASSKKSLNIVIKYFNCYKLYSSKYLDYINWIQASSLLLDGKAYLPENKKIIYDLKHSMNSKRCIFTWTHLKNL